MIMSCVLAGIAMAIFLFFVLVVLIMDASSLVTWFALAGVVVGIISLAHHAKRSKSL